MKLPDDLVAEIEATPDDPAPYAVAADWLQQHGDPHGELIALALDGGPAHGPRIRQLQAELDPIRRVHGWHVTWRRGFATRLCHWPRLDPDARQLATFLAAPIARVLQELAITALTEDWLPEFTAAIATAPPHTLRSLVLRDDGRLASNAVDLAPLVAQLPRLEHLVLDVPHDSAAFALPHLRELAMLADDIILGSLEDADLPALHTLRLWLPMGAGDLETDLAPARFPALRHLTLVAPRAELDLGRLATLPIAAQLDTFETMFMPTWERDPRRFAIDRTPTDSPHAVLLDMGRSPTSVAGRVTQLEPSRAVWLGRSADNDLVVLDGPDGRIGSLEWTGSWWSFQSRTGTLVNGHATTHVRMHAGDELQIGFHVFRFVTGEPAAVDAQIAELRARFALPTLSPVALRA